MPLHCDEGKTYNIQSAKFQTYLLGIISQLLVYEKLDFI